LGVNFFQKPYQIIKDWELKEILAKMNEQSKELLMPAYSEDYQEQESDTNITPIFPQ